MRKASVLAVFFALFASSLASGEDQHDKLVYGRYSHGLQAAKIKYPDVYHDLAHKELAHPATKKDVENGLALFTFEGLGSSRSWRLPKCPLDAVWNEKDKYSVEEPGDDSWSKGIYVCQAEELQVDGKWKRYFGCLTKHGMAVVPGEQIRLRLPDLDKADVFYWTNASGIDWGLRRVLTDEERRAKKRFVLGEALQFEAYVRNSLGKRQQVPTIFYRDGKNGGPSFRTGIRLTMTYEPLKDDGRPDYQHTRSLEALATTTFEGDQKSVDLDTNESVKTFQFDIRDHFRIERAGNYTMSMIISNKTLAVGEPASSPTQAIMEFIIHEKEKVSSIAR